MTTKLTAAHLKPFLQVLEASVRDGTIPLDLAMDFSIEIDFLVLDERVRQGYSRILREPPPKPVTRLSNPPQPPQPPLPPGMKGTS